MGTATEIRKVEVGRDLDPTTLDVFRRAIGTLNRAKAPYLVGGAYALALFSGYTRHTRDFDIFVRREDCTSVLSLLAKAGFKTELTFPHWLGKAFCGDDFVDVIFSSGNGIATVDELWFLHATEASIWGQSILLCPMEEIIWSKAFVMERERFDGADVAHLIHVQSDAIDWPRLIMRFGDHYRVLMSHLVLFGFIYPTERDRIPDWVMTHLTSRLQEEASSSRKAERVCQGTLLSRQQYLADITHGGYEDARLSPRGPMTEEQIVHWTAAIHNIDPHH